MTRLTNLALAAALATGSAAAADKKAPAVEPQALVMRGAVASTAQGAFETGRLTSPEQTVAGPFVLTYAGDALEVVTVVGGHVLGLVSPPLAAPFHLGHGTFLRLRGSGQVLYAGIRPIPATRALEAYLGRPIWLSAGSGEPEQWTLREIGGDHVTVERSRSYRIIALRRIAEIDWTDLTGADPTPRVVLSPE
jgi:hypothetical protein